MAAATMKSRNGSSAPIGSSIKDLEDLIAACKHEDARVEDFDTVLLFG